jgi:hypothetical protein
VVVTEPTSVGRRGPELRDTWQCQSSPLGEAESGAMGHVAVLELSSRGGRTRSHGTCGSAGAHVSREVRSGAEECVVAPELNSARR